MEYNILLQLNFDYFYKIYLLKIMQFLFNMYHDLRHVRLNFAPRNRNNHLLIYRNMEKKMTVKETKSMEIQSIIVAVSILFSALTAVLGYGMLSIGNAMVLAFYFVMVGMSKDLKELCNGLADECESES